RLCSQRHHSRLLRSGLGHLFRYQCALDVSHNPRRAAGYDRQWRWLNRQRRLRRLQRERRAQPLSIRRHQGCGGRSDQSRGGGFRRPGHPLQCHLSGHGADSFPGRTHQRLRRSKSRARGLHRPPAHGPPRHCGRNRSLSRLPCLRRINLYNGHRSHHRRRYDYL
ncbi:uncharacterized protein METZ01_LOCUS313380, partial [marine metagenome]